MGLVDGYVQPPVGSEILLSRVIYGESLVSPAATNHRGRVYRSYGGGGESTTPAYDFEAHPTSTELRLPLDPTAKNDWTGIANQNTIATMATAAASLLETTTYTSSSTHDALGSQRCRRRRTRPSAARLNSPRPSCAAG